MGTVPTRCFLERKQANGMAFSALFLNFVANKLSE